MAAPFLTMTRKEDVREAGAMIDLNTPFLSCFSCNVVLRARRRRHARVSAFAGRRRRRFGERLERPEAHTAFKSHL
jgi:hypothetical protein